MYFDEEVAKKIKMKIIIKSIMSLSNTVEKRSPREAKRVVSEKEEPLRLNEYFGEPCGKPVQHALHTLIG